MKFIWIDFWYDQAFKAAGTTDYQKLHLFSHGTSDYWDIALRSAGHESDTLIGNVEYDIIEKAIAAKPDVICVQNVGLWQPALLKARGFQGKCVAFCSYAAERSNLHGWDVVFSSFKWLVDRLNADGQKAVYLPLAFGRPVLDRFPYSGERDLPLTFVGGLGHRIWHKGTDTLNTVAERFPEQFKWWGYRIDTLPQALKSTYQGEAWGPTYWNILMRSQIVINRHGEISKGEGNNMRNYEAAAIGAMLLTDERGEVFGAKCYTNVENLTDHIYNELGHHDNHDYRQAIQEKMLEHHCYENRVPKFIETVISL